jgi:hypothetical protein
MSETHTGSRAKQTLKLTSIKRKIVPHIAKLFYQLVTLFASTSAQAVGCGFTMQALREMNFRGILPAAKHYCDMGINECNEDQTHVTGL